MEEDTKYVAKLVIVLLGFVIMVAIVAIGKTLCTLSCPL